MMIAALRLAIRKCKAARRFDKRTKKNVCFCGQTPDLNDPKQEAAEYEMPSLRSVCNFVGSEKLTGYNPNPHIT